MFHFSTIWGRSVFPQLEGRHLQQLGACSRTGYGNVHIWLLSPHVPPHIGSISQLSVSVKILFSRTSRPTCLYLNLVYIQRSAVNAPFSRAYIFDNGDQPIKLHSLLNPIAQYNEAESKISLTMHYCGFSVPRTTQNAS